MQRFESPDGDGGGFLASQVRRFKRQRPAGGSFCRQMYSAFAPGGNPRGENLVAFLEQFHVLAGGFHLAASSCPRMVILFGRVNPTYRRMGRRSMGDIFRLRISQSPAVTVVAQMRSGLHRPWGWAFRSPLLVERPAVRILSRWQLSWLHSRQMLVGNYPAGTLPILT